MGVTHPFCVFSEESKERKVKDYERKEKILSLVLCVVMMFSMFPQAVSADGTWSSGAPGETGRLCEHHPKHTAQCSYSSGTAGTPCTFAREICNPKDSGEAEEATPSNAIDSAVTDVQKLIEAFSGDHWL